MEFGNKALNGNGKKRYTMTEIDAFKHAVSKI